MLGVHPTRGAPPALFGPTAAAYENQIYAFGSETSDGVTGKLERHDPRAGALSLGTPLPAALSAYALAVLEGKLYLFGGWGGVTVRCISVRLRPRSRPLGNAQPAAKRAGMLPGALQPEGSTPWAGLMSAGRSQRTMRTSPKGKWKATGHGGLIAPFRYRPMKSHLMPR